LRVVLRQERVELDDEDRPDEEAREDHRRDRPVRDVGDLPENRLEVALGAQADVEDLAKEEREPAELVEEPSDHRSHRFASLCSPYLARSSGVRRSSVSARNSRIRVSLERTVSGTVPRNRMLPPSRTRIRSAILSA